MGAREWIGRSIDVPVMGYDGYPETAGYCEIGDRPEFKLFRPVSGQLINLTGEFPVWTNNLIWYAGSLENVITVPDVFKLGKPYPNPFNPTTNITFEIPIDCEVELSVYDLNGRLVQELVSDFLETGYYEIQWNASNQASGMYFMRMVMPKQTMTRKLILMK